jgi:hypothetical protein
VAEWKILEDAVGIGWPEEPGLSQGATAAGTLSLKQMAAACASEEDFSPARYLETFGHGFSCLNALGRRIGFVFLSRAVFCQHNGGHKKGTDELMAFHTTIVGGQ